MSLLLLAWLSAPQYLCTAYCPFHKGLYEKIASTEDEARREALAYCRTEHTICRVLDCYQL